MTFRSPGSDPPISAPGALFNWTPSLWLPIAVRPSMPTPMRLFWISTPWAPPVTMIPGPTFPETTLPNPSPGVPRMFPPAPLTTIPEPPLPIACRPFGRRADPIADDLIGGGRIRPAALFDEDPIPRVAGDHIPEPGRADADGVVRRAHQRDPLPVRGGGGPRRGETQIVAGDRIPVAVFQHDRRIGESHQGQAPDRGVAGRDHQPVIRGPGQPGAVDLDERTTLVSELGRPVDGRGDCDHRQR